MLLVEDELLIRYMALDMLEEAGLEGVPAENAEEAAGILQIRSDIGAFFTDVDMPGSMNGIALARLVGQRWPELPAS